MNISSSEHILIEQARAGDKDAFGLLAKNHQRRIHSLALHYCRNRQNAEDLSQEVWLKAYKSIGSFRGEASFYTWLRQITINTFRNHTRKTTLMHKDAEAVVIKMEELDLDGPIDSLTTPRALGIEEDIHAKILVDRVMHALSELTAQQRLIFLLKHQEEMTYEEISQALGCSTGTIKKSLFRTIIKLRQRLDINVRAADYAPFATGDNR